MLESQHCQTFRVLARTYSLILLLNINASSLSAQTKGQDRLHDSSTKIAFATDEGIFVIGVEDTKYTKALVASYFDPEVDSGLRYLPRPMWSPDGTKLTYRYHKLYVMKEIPSWYPKGLSTVGSKDYVSVVGSDGSDLKIISPGSHSSWSPDGNSLIFVGSDSATKKERLAVIPSDGITPPNFIGPTLFNGGLAIYSPDGKEILYESGYDLFLIKLDGTNLQHVAKGECPNYSPDGKSILFSATIDNKTSIYLMDLKTKSQRKLISDIGNNSQPSWAPDGRKIVFWSDRDGEGALYISNSDGLQIERLQGTNGARYPSWSPFLKKK